MTWRTILIVGAAASAAAVGCTVTAGTGSIDGGGGGGAVDSGSGATASGGKAGASGSGGTSGSAGAKTGGAGGTAGCGSTCKGDAAPDGPIYTTCSPDPMKPCDLCVQTKCCQEWLDCANDTDCLKSMGGKDPEFTCIQACLIGDGGTIMTVADCAGMCQHGVTVSDATNALITCMREQGDSGKGPQNCTNECFGQDLP